MKFQGTFWACYGSQQEGRVLIGSVHNEQMYQMNLEVTLANI